jgi:hypothetical protein
MKIETRQYAMGLVLLALIFASFEVAPVAAAFGGALYPPYDYQGTTSTDAGITVSASKSSGVCTVKAVDKFVFLPYSAGAYGRAWVGSDKLMTQSVTATWCISSTWTLDYRICAGSDFWWHPAEIKIGVIYQVYNSAGKLLQEKYAWSAGVYTTSGWVNEEYVITRSIEKRFSVDLANGNACVIKVALEVKVIRAGPYYQATARTNHGQPASLTVSRIEYYLP